MRYLLIVGFFCKLYKKKPRIRLSINNQFIDEFDVEHNESLFKEDDIYERFLEQKNDLQPKFNYWQKTFKEFPHLHIFEIEINEKNIKIVIDVNNDDNNYQNGFMSKNTLLQLRFFYFLPMEKEILTRFSNLLLKKKYRNLAWFFRKNHKEFKDVFDLGCLTKWVTKKDCVIIENDNQQSIMSYNVGGSGYFEIDLKKKYGLLLPIVPYKFMYCKKSLLNLINSWYKYVN